MPDIGASIRTKTLADGTVAGLVSTRMYADAIPQSVTLPAISYSIIDTMPEECLTAIAAYARARIQIDCYATSRGAANSLADAVRLALEKFSGAISSQWVFELSLVSGEYYGIDAAESGTDQRRYVTSLDFFVHYATSTSQS